MNRPESRSPALLPPRRRAELREAGRRTSARLDIAGTEPGPRSRHPAGRGRRPQPEVPQAPCLVLLPGAAARRPGLTGG